MAVDDEFKSHRYEAHETSSNEGKSIDSDGVPAMEAVGSSVTTTGLQRKLAARHIQVGQLSILPQALFTRVR